MKRWAFVLFFVQFLLFLGDASAQVNDTTQTTISQDSANFVPTLLDSLIPEGGVDPSKDTTNPRDKVIEMWKKKSDLKEVVTYSAEDSITLNMQTNYLQLYNTGKVAYEEMELNGGHIAVKLDSNELKATGILDSTGNVVQRPNFVDKGQDYGADTMRYNFKTRKGKVIFARTKQGKEEFIAGQVVKLAGQDKNGKDIIYIKNGTFTSCENEHPHYYIRSKKLKIIPGDRIISGPLQLVVADFPLPIGLPFGFFPNQEGRRSGILLPEYGEANDRGFFLKNLGYYLAVSDNFDIGIRGDIYTKGGWRAEIFSNYNKRYRTSGNLNLQVGYRKFGEREDPGFSEDMNFNIKWNHNQTITPTASLRAKVNAGSSGFFRTNSYDAQDFLSNTLQSSVSFNKKFANSPYNLTVNLDHSQNNSTRIMNLGIPGITFVRARTYPFKKIIGRNATGLSWLKDIGYSYTFNAKNQISAIDSIIPRVISRPNDSIRVINFDSEGNPTDTTVTLGWDNFKNGIKHTVPVQTSISLLKYVTLTPQFTFNEYWSFTKTNRRWDGEKVAATNERGFFTHRDFNTSVTAQTILYGFYYFTGKTKPTIRHTITPNIGYRFNPDFSQEKWGIIDRVQSDTLGNTSEFNRYSQNLFRSSGSQEQQAITFGLTNVLELKFKDLKAARDTADVPDSKKGNGEAEDPYKKVRLLDNLSVNSSYNFAADSLNLAPFQLAARTNLFNNKLNIQLNSTLDPYKYDTAINRRVNTFMWESDRKLGRISNFTANIGTTLRSKKTFTGSGAKVDRPKDAEDERTPEEIRLFMDKYVDFDIPWSASFNYSFVYTNNGSVKDTTQTIRVNGDFSLSPKWKISYQTGFDFSAQEISFTQLSIHRDLHCWEMSFTWTPFGDLQSFIFSLNVRNPTLKDLKLQKRSNFQDRQF